MYRPLLSVIAKVALGADPPQRTTNKAVAVTLASPEGSIVPNASDALDGALNLQLLVDKTVALTAMVADELPAENATPGSARKPANNSLRRDFFTQSREAWKGELGCRTALSFRRR